MIVVILGPTASGKTDFVEKIYPYFNNPLIVNGDAFQIYSEMNIGTAKISPEDPLFKHYALLNLKTPDQTYSIFDYQNDFCHVVNNALKNHRDVIVIGGSGLYIRAALFDYNFIDVQEKKDTIVNEKMSSEELYHLLIEKDPQSALKIHPNNKKRVIRALQILEESGKSKSEIIDEQEHKPIYSDVRFFFVNPDREELYKRIDERVDKMFDRGLIEEVKGLITKYSLSVTAKAAIGYKETIDYLDGKISLNEAKELIKKRTRNYAKRQITFFKHQFINKEFQSFDDLNLEIKNWRNKNDK